MTLHGFSLLSGLMVIWTVFTSFLVILLIYRGVVGMHEDDQLYLHDGEAGLQREREHVLSKLKKLQPYIRTLTAVSGGLIMVIAGLWLYQGISRVP